MASKEEIQKNNIKEANTLLGEQINLITQLADVMKNVVAESKTKSTLEKGSLDLSRQAVKVTRDLSSEYDSLAAVQKDIAKSRKLQQDLEKQSIALQKQFGGNEDQLLEKYKKKLAESKKADHIARALEEKQKKGMKISDDQIKRAQELAAQKQEELALTGANLENYQEQMAFLEEQKQVLAENLAYLAEQERRQKNLLNSGSLLTDAFSGLGKIASKLGFEKLGKMFGDASEKAKEIAYRLTDGGKKSLGFFGKMRAAVGGLGAALKTALGPMALIGMLVAGFNKFKERAEKAAEYLHQAEQDTADMGRSLGLSASKTTEIAAQAVAAAGPLGMVGSEAKKAAGEIYGALDGTEKISTDTLQVYMKLQKFAGMSADDIKNINTYTKLSGQSASVVADEMATTAQESIKALKLNVSMKTIMQDVGKVSSNIKLQFQGSAKGITAAVAQAKKLGLEMKDVESIADSLLNIEDSLAAEMEAELLTGKELNLEKARAAALNGDSVALMEALAEQGITQADYANMNVIQQEALAKSLGMNRGQMADMLVKSKENTAANTDTVDMQKKGVEAMTGMVTTMESLKKLEEERNKANAEAGEKFAAFEKVILKIQTLLEPILNEIFMPILDIMTNILSKTLDWLKESGALEVITNMIKGTFEMIGEIFEFLWETFEPLFSALMELGENIMPLIQGIFEGLQPVIGFIATTVGQILGFVVGLITPIVEFVNKLISGNGEPSKMEKIVGSIVVGIGGMIALMKTVQGISLAIKTIKIATNAEARKEYAQMIKNKALQVGDFFKSMGTAVAKIFSAFGQIPFGVGIPLAIAAAAGLGTLAYSYFNKGDDVMSPGANDGYGSRTLMGPEGAIRLNNNDTVIAGTNLFDKGNQGGGGADNGAMVAELQRISGLLNQLLNKEGAVYIDGNKVGATIALTNYQQQ